jgi:hypothetical protein
VILKRAGVSPHQQVRRESIFGAVAAILAFFVSVGFGARWTALLDYSYLPNLATGSIKHVLSAA